MALQPMRETEINNAAEQAFYAVGVAWDLDCLRYKMERGRRSAQDL
jgi:hypothetical protein